MLTERSGTMNKMSANSIDRGFLSRQQLNSGGWKTRQQVEEQKRRQCPLQSHGLGNSESIYLSPFLDACSLKHHFSAPSCGPALTLYHDWQWEKKKKRKKDTVRLVDAEGLPKVWGWATPILNSDLCTGGSARTHLFCWIFFYSNQASPRLQRGQWMLLPGHLFETRFPPVSRILLASPSSALAYTFLQVSTVVVVVVGGQKTKPGCLVRGQTAGKEGASRGRGRWLLARKAEGVLEIVSPLKGENQDWNRKWERFHDKNGRRSARVIQSLHWLESLLSTQRSRVGAGPSRPPASLSLQFQGCSPGTILDCEAV